MDALTASASPPTAAVECTTATDIVLWRNIVRDVGPRACMQSLGPETVLCMLRMQRMGAWSCSLGLARDMSSIVEYRSEKKQIGAVTLTWLAVYLPFSCTLIDGDDLVQRWLLF